MDISVIIPIYNGERTLRRCLDSICAQTYDSFEVIMINDGSKDNSLAIMNEYAAKDARFRVLDKPNGGVSSARNLGLRYALGEFVQFVDADDDIRKDMLEKMIATIRQHNADMVTCRFIHDCWKPYLPSGVYYMKDRKDCLRFFSDFFTFNVPWNKLIRRELIGHTFNESIKIFEDGLFVLENFDRINKVVVLREELYNYFNAGSEADSAVNAFLKTKFWETREGYWFKQLLVKKPFEEALKRLSFERTESFIRTRMFDMAFIELVKLIDGGVSEEICINEMFAIFSAPEFVDSLQLFCDKSFCITFPKTVEFVNDCFAAYNSYKKYRHIEPFFAYIDCFMNTFSTLATDILDIISKRLSFKKQENDEVFALSFG